jgi:hypothetical protein
LCTFFAITVLLPISYYQDGPIQWGRISGTSNFEANVFGIHYGNNFIAVLYSDLVSGFEINGLRNGVSNIYAFTTVTAVPLPAAVWLFGTAILALLGITRRRRMSAA